MTKRPSCVWGGDTTLPLIMKCYVFIKMDGRLWYKMIPLNEEFDIIVFWIAFDGTVETVETGMERDSVEP